MTAPTLFRPPAEYAELAAALKEKLKTPEETISEYAFYLLEALDRPEFDSVYKQLASWPTAPSQHRSTLVRDTVKGNIELARWVLEAREATKR